MKRLFLALLVLTTSPISSIKAHAEGPLVIDMQGITHYFDFQGFDGEPNGKRIFDRVTYTTSLIPRGKQKFTPSTLPTTKTWGLKMTEKTAYGEIIDTKYQLVQKGTIAANLNLVSCVKDARTYRTIVSRYNSLRNQRGFIFGVNSKCQLTLIASPDGGRYTIGVSSIGTIPLQKTVHVALRLEVGGIYTFFMNGKDIGRGTLPASHQTLFSSRAPLIVGAASKSSSIGDMRFDGLIDNLVIAERPLTQNEIQRLSNTSGLDTK